MILFNVSKETFRRTVHSEGKLVLRKFEENVDKFV